MVLLLVTVAAIGPRLRREFFPEVDSGAFEMTVRAASGTRLEVTEQRVAEVEQLLRETLGDDLQLVIAEVGAVADWSAAYTSNAGPMDASLKVQLKTHRSHSSQEHVRRLRERLAASPEFSDLEIGFDTGGMIRTAMNGGKSTPINIRVTGKNLPQLSAVANSLRSRVAKVDGVVDVRVLQRLDYPQYVVEVNRDRAADLGLPLPYVVKNIVAALSGSIQFNKKNFYLDPVTNGQYYVGVQYAEEDIDSLETLLDVPITSPAQDVSIPLRNLVTINRSKVPTEVVHQDLQTGIDLVMAIDGRDLGHVAEDVVATLVRCGVRQEDGSWIPYAPPNKPQARGESGNDGLSTTPASFARAKTVDSARIRMSGEYVRMQSMFKNLGGRLAMATVLIYLLLVMQFQSFRLPLVILLSVPLGLIGVVWMLYLTGTAINVQSLLGVIFMVGVVVANSVMLIEYAQNLRQTERLNAFDAIRQAACVRMRPILMTALAALLALLPMALAFGRGSEANAPLGRAVIGGLIAGLVTTLLVVPSLYAWMIRDDGPQTEPTSESV
jgi:multidrug efflux pump subunit AcrB